MPDLGPG